MAKAKKIEALDCEAEALSGVRLVLQTRLGEILDLRAAALNWEDIEGVHDMRVASRRLRSAIKDFGSFLGKKSLPKRRLKEVADALGEVRDQDVAIAALEKMRAEAGAADVGAGIARLVAERAAVRDVARRKMSDIVTETSLAELQQKFLARLEEVGGTATTGGKDVSRKQRGRRAPKVVSFRQAGREIIAARIAELQELSDSLHHPFVSEPLHDMRIAAKRLRYAIELFGQCWSGKLSSYSREVSELQTSLGELRDCDIWIADLGARLDRERAASAPAVTDAADAQGQVRRAAIFLLNHFTKERGNHFRDALARWEEWETTGFFARMESDLDKEPPTTSTATTSTATTGADAAIALEMAAVVHATTAPPTNDNGSKPQADAPSLAGEVSLSSPDKIVSSRKRQNLGRKRK